MTNYETGEFELFILIHDSLGQDKEELDAEGNLLHDRSRDESPATDRANAIIARITSGACPAAGCYYAWRIECDCAKAVLPTPWPTSRTSDVRYHLGNFHTGPATHDVEDTKQIDLDELDRKAYVLRCAVDDVLDDRQAHEALSPK